MPRFFIAIPLPDEVTDRLIAVQPPSLSGMRLLGRQELHLTLNFLGEVAPHHQEVVRKALASVKANAFTITICGVGQFPPDGQAQVIWVSVDRSDSLFALHHCIGTILTDAIGFQPEDRPYSPHITLARLNTPDLTGAIERYLNDSKSLQVPSVLVNRFVLYSSVFVDNVPKYREEAVFHLIQPGSLSRHQAPGSARTGIGRPPINS